MAKVRTIFTSDDKEVAKSLEKLQAKMVALEEKNKKLAREAKKASRAVKDSGDEATSSFEVARGAAASLLEGLNPVQWGIQKITEAYGGWRQEIEKVAEVSRNLSNDVSRELLETGDLLNRQQVEHFLNTLPNATRRQGLDALTGVSGAAPTSSLDRREEIARSVAGMAATGADMSTLGQAAGAIAELNPNRSGDDVLDVVTALRAGAGDAISQVGSRQLSAVVKQLVKSGAVGNDEEALAVVLSAVQADQSVEPIQAAAAAVMKSDHRSGTEQAIAAGRRDSSGRLIPLTTREKALNRFGEESDKRERFRMLLADQEVSTAVLGGEQAARLQTIDPENFGLNLDAIRSAQKDNLASQQLGALSTSQKSEQESLAFQDSVSRLAGLRQQQYERVYRDVQAASADASVLMGLEANARLQFTRPEINELFEGGLGIEQLIGPHSPGQFVLQGNEVQAIRERERGATEEINILREQLKEMRALRSSASAATVNPDRHIE